MLARFVDSRRFHATLIIAMGTAFPPAFVFGGAAAALVTLRRGLIEGLVLALIGWSAVVALLALVGHPPDAALAGMLGVLAAIVLMAAVLGRYAALHAAIWVGVALALAGLTVFWLAVADPVSYWRDAFERTLEALIAQMRASGGAPPDEDRLRLVVEAQPWRVASGTMFATLLLIGCVSLFLGRSWQARLVNPGGFRGEFHRLRLKRPLAAATAACFILVPLWPWDWMLNVAVVLLTVWTVQGFAVIHGLIGILTATGGGWLVVVYALSVAGWLTANPLVIAVPLLGLINEFFDVRVAAARHVSK